MKECKYRLPCNYCDKYDRVCDVVEFEINNMTMGNCKHDWLKTKRVTIDNVVFETHKCRRCGVEQEIRVERLNDGKLDITLCN